MKIVTYDALIHLDYGQALREMLEAKWGAFPPFDRVENGLATPAPILALDNADLLGGLVFSIWASPKSGEPAIWINGLIVKPQYRGKGIAGQLIRAAMETRSQLFAKTAVADLYRKNGWLDVTKEDAEDILMHDASIAK